MLIIKLALRNLSRNTKKTLLIGMLISSGMALLFFSGAVFESTNRGLKTSFTGSLTGDVALSARSDVPFSLFGVEVPIISDYENIPPIYGYPEMADSLGTMENVEAWTPVVSAAAFLETVAGNSRTAVPVFGVDPETYFSVCRDIIIEKGDTSMLSRGGIFLNERLAAEVEEDLGRELSIGEPLQLSMYSDGSFRIRRGVFSGVIGYVSYTDPLDRVVLADASLVRSIVNYTLGIIDEPDTGSEDYSGDDLFDLDSLFESSAVPESVISGPEEVVAGNSVPEAGDELTLEYVEEILSEEEELSFHQIDADSAAWSFVLFRAAEGKATVLRKTLARNAEEQGWPVRVLDWRSAAGLGAQAVFALQSIFYGGIIFILFGAVLVIMNGLVISVFERITEIGTMRGLGAGKGFIRALFITESMLLTITASSVGILAGIILSHAVSVSGISVNNELLAVLFGGNVIRPLVTVSGVLKHLFFAFAAASLAWIYPVSLAIKIQPAEIMGKD